MRIRRTSLAGWSGRLTANRTLKNVGANLIGSGWNGLLIILVTPWYVSRLGLEGYGLVAFWMMMQVMLLLGDLGLGAALVKEFATVEGQPGIPERRRDLLRTLESLYWPMAALITALLLGSAGWIAGHWLKLQAMEPGQAAKAIQWMALALGLQFPNALYSSGLAGLQRQGRMNALQMLGNSLRYGGGVAILFLKADIVWFFAVQAFVAAAQTAGTGAVLWRLVRQEGGRRPVFQAGLLKQLWRFSAGMACTVLASVVLANIDRLVLSKLMPAAELGKYAMALTATGLLQLGIQPFYRAYFPRFAELVAAGDAAKLRREYYQGCRWMARVIIPFALIGWAFAPEIFIAWIGRADETVVRVFRWLLLGMSGAGLVWLPAAFQQAHGWTRLHAAMIIGALGIGLPCIGGAIHLWGTVGATAAWVLHGLSDSTLGLWLMHRRLLPGEMMKWYRAVVGPPLLVALPIVGLSRWLKPAGLGRWSVAAWIAATAFLAAASLLAVEWHRARSADRSASRALK